MLRRSRRRARACLPEQLDQLARGVGALLFRAGGGEALERRLERPQRVTGSPELALHLTGEPESVRSIAASGVKPKLRSQWAASARSRSSARACSTCHGSSAWVMRRQTGAAPGIGTRTATSKGSRDPYSIASASTLSCD
ncbi:MAG: hypothetical protein LCH31_11365, partial [Actinobacteria bacterium]|nr:hypothetical protein [Actinomycetota bacterium]